MAKKLTLETCKTCGAVCCRHVAIHLDEPDCKLDYDNIRWMLMHENVNVVKDHDDDWLVEFITPCSMLNSDNSCARYDDRPRVCRRYPAKDEECEYTGDGDSYVLRFTTAEEFERYLEKQGTKWRYKKP